MDYRRLRQRCQQAICRHLRLAISTRKQDFVAGSGNLATGEQMPARVFDVHDIARIERARNVGYAHAQKRTALSH